MPSLDPPVNESVLNIDTLCLTLIQNNGGYHPDRISQGFERIWLNANKTNKNTAPALNTTDAITWKSIHSNKSIRFTPIPIRKNNRSWCTKYGTTLLLCSSIFGIYTLRSILSIISSVGFLTNNSMFQQMYVTASFVLVLLCVHAMIIMMQDSISELLSTPPIVIHDVISMMIRDDSTLVVPSKSKSESKSKSKSKSKSHKKTASIASVVLRYGPFVECVYYDQNLIKVYIVSNESIPYPCMTRRALSCSIQTDDDDSSIRAVHTFRVLIAAAIERLNSAMYDVSIGIKEDSDQERYVEKQQNIRKSGQKKEIAMTHADNIEAWRFAAMKDPVSNLLNSTRVSMDRLDKRFRLLKKLYKQGVQAISINDSIKYLILRMSYTAVEQSNVIRPPIINDINDITNNNTNHDNDDIKLSSDGRTTSLRLWPSIKHRLSIPTEVWKDVMIAFREGLLDMGKTLEGQLNIQPTVSIQRMKLLDTLMSTETIQQSKKKLNKTLELNDQRHSTNLNEHHTDVNNEYIEILRGDVIEHIINYIFETTFASVVEILQKSYIPDNRIGLHCRVEVVRHTVSIIWTKYKKVLERDLWNDLDKRYLSLQYPYILNDGFANYFDRMGIKMMNDEDVYGRMSKKELNAIATEENKKNLPNLQTAKNLRTEDRDKPHIRYMLSHFHTSKRKLTDCRDQHQASSIPVASFQYLEKYIGQRLTLEKYSLLNVFVNTIKFIKELQLVILILLPFSSDFISSYYERMLTTIVLGISLDLRSPWLIFLSVVIASSLSLLLFISVIYSFSKLYESRSPLNRSTYNMMSALENCHIQKEKTNIELELKTHTSSCINRCFFILCPNFLDGIGILAKTAKFIRGTLWGYTINTANGGLATFQGRPINIDNVNESVMWSCRIQILLHVLSLFLPTIVSGMLLSSRCVLCENEVKIPQQLQFVGNQNCFAAPQILFSFFVTLFAPLPGILIIFVCMYPTIVVVCNFYSKYSPGGLHSEKVYEGLHLYDLLGTFQSPSKMSFDILWRTLLALLHVVFRSTSTTGSTTVMLPSLMYLFVTTTKIFFQTNISTSISKSKSIMKTLNNNKKTLFLNLIVLTTFIWSPNFNNDMTVLDIDPYANTDVTTTQPVLPTRSKSSCNFDGNNWCGWINSGEKSFSHRIHPPDPEAAAIAAKAAKDKAEAASQQTTDTTPASSTPSASEEEAPLINNYVQNLGIPRQCLATCFTPYYAYLESPIIISPLPDPQTCLSISYRIGTGKRRIVDPPENPYSSSLALQWRDVELNKDEDIQWNRFWNISNYEQNGNDDWRTSGKIYIPTNKETVIRLVAKMYGGGSFVSIDDVEFGCQGKPPIVPEIFKPAFISSCSTGGWGGNIISLCPFVFPIFLLVINLVWFTLNSTVAKRDGERLQQKSKNNDENTHLKYFRKYEIRFKKKTIGRDCNGIRFPACTPLVHPNPSASPQYDSITVNISELIAPNTTQRTESHVRISLFQPIDCIAPCQQAVLTGETPETEGIIIHLKGRMYKRTAIHDCPLSINSKSHKWYGNDVPCFTFPSIEDVVDARFLIYIGNAPWSLLSNSLLTEEASTCNIKLDLLQMEEVDGKWYLDNPLVFRPTNKSLKFLESSKPDIKLSEEASVKSDATTSTKKSVKKMYLENVVNTKSIEAWRAFIALASTKKYDGDATLTFGREKNAPFKIKFHLKCQARIKTITNVVLKSLHPQYNLYVSEIAIKHNKVMELDIFTNRKQTLLNDNEDNALLERMLEASIQLGYGHYVSVTNIRIKKNILNPNYQSCNCKCAIRCREFGRCFLLAKILVTLLRIVSITMSFVYSFIRYILITVRDCCVSFGRLIAWLWRRSIIIKEDTNVHVVPGKIPKGKIMAGRTLTVRHDFKNVSKDRMLYVWKDAVVTKVLSGRRLVVKYDDNGNKDVVKAESVRALGSVLEEMKRGSLDTSRKKKDGVEEEEEKKKVVVEDVEA